MALAQRQVGVTRGYKVKVNRVEREEPETPAWIAQVGSSLRAGARELCELFADEIVYATMDTVRVMNFVRYELGFRTRERVEPVVHDLENFVQAHDLIHEVGTLQTEQAGVLAKR
jgi:hypothetical protein